MSTHPQVPHPSQFLDRERGRLALVNDWATRHLALTLGSAFGMWVAVVLPLVALEIPPLLKLLGLFSSYWVQLWALFVLQRSANRADVKRDAKADADHLALVSIHHAVDEAVRRLRELPGKAPHDHDPVS